MIITRRRKMMTRKEWLKRREEWKKERLNGIGASESAAILGLSPYKTNVELWQEKARRRVADDISDKDCVKYGIDAEQPLRELFALDFPQYAVGYEEFKIIRNPQYPFIFATLDGELSEMEEYEILNGGIIGTAFKVKRYGILEIKTTEIQQSSQWVQWDNRLPDGYYLQCLHQLLATGYDFAILKAQIKYHKGNDMILTTRHYTIERSEVEDDLKMLLEKEIAFWDCVQNDRKPALILPGI